jgi:hypothetical protein
MNEHVYAIKKTYTRITFSSVKKAEKKPFKKTNNGSPNNNLKSNEKLSIKTLAYSICSR